MSKTLAIVAIAGAVAFTACESFGQAMTAHTDVVARAAGHELTADEVVALLAPNPSIPPQADVVDAVANLWVDYILLATMAAQDTTLRSIDLEPLIRPGIEQDMVWKLRDKVITVDTAFTDEQLRALYLQEQPGLQVRARHILLRLPADATPAQRDSVMNLARRIQQQAAGGADFSALARQHGQDPSAPQGGDLGFFGKGQMVAPFEEAAFALQPGQVSDVVETPFGLHVIKVEERKLPPFEEIRDAYREQARSEAQFKAEEAYVKGLTDPLQVKVDEEAFDVTRELARAPNKSLSARAGNRSLVSYKGGALTAREFQELMRRFAPGQRARYASATDEQLAQVLEGLAKNEILIAEARKQGFDAAPAQRDSLIEEARRQLDAAASASGLKNVQPQAGETREQAIDRKVMSLLEAIIRGEQNVLPLGPITFFLREKHQAQIFERSFPEVVAKLEAQRPATPQPGMPPMPQPQPPQPDSGR